jgi:multiple sugar transport system permease protein
MTAATVDPQAPTTDDRSASRRSRRVRLAGKYLALTVLTLFFLAPLLWMVSTSLKPSTEYFTPDIRWIPREPTLEHYRGLLGQSQAPVLKWLINSIAISTATTLVVLVIDSLAAYAFARMRFRFRDTLFSLVLLTLFFPAVMFLIPNFITVHRLGLLDTRTGVVLPMLASVLGVFFLRQFFLALPRDLEEAAYVDGANRLQTFVRIILPLSKGPLSALAIITFLISWNDFLWPLLVLNTGDRQTLPVGLAALQGAYISEYGTVMAGAVIVAAPVLLIYVVLQRHIIQSVASTGLKG